MRMSRALRTASLEVVRAARLVRQRVAGSRALLKRAFLRLDALRSVLAEARLPRFQKTTEAPPLVSTIDCVIRRHGPPAVSLPMSSVEGLAVTA
jgi:hypothetical protein